jgi:hypothetical protein
MYKIDHFIGKNPGVTTGLGLAAASGWHKPPLPLGRRRTPAVASAEE